MPADHPDREIFDAALDTVWLPGALNKSYDVHDGERPGPGAGPCHGTRAACPTGHNPRVEVLAVPGGV